MSTKKSNGGPFVTFREECEILRARVVELEAQLAEAKSKQVSGFFHDEVPTFQQGEPNHEVLELITAKDCTGYVEKIVELRERLSEKDKLILLAKEGLKRCITLGFGTDCEMYAKEALDAIDNDEMLKNLILCGAEPIGEIEVIDVDEDAQPSAWIRINTDVELGDQLYAPRRIEK